MNEKDVERLKEIIKCAYELNWIKAPNRNSYDSYPIMQLSEVEKCMLAMTDDLELERLKRWVSETKILDAMERVRSDKFGSLFTEMREALKEPTFVVEPEKPKKNPLFTDITSTAASDVPNPTSQLLDKKPAQTNP